VAEEGFLNKLPGVSPEETESREGGNGEKTGEEDVEVQMRGKTISFDDYSKFQLSQATATDQESLIMLRTALAKGETNRGMDPMKWAVAIIVFMIGAAIAWYIISDMGLLSGLTGGGGGGGKGGVNIAIGALKAAI